MAQEILPLLRETFSPASPELLAEYPQPADAARILQSSTSPVFFIDSSTDPARALALLEVLGAPEARAKVVSLHATGDPDLILKSMRSGAGAVLVRPFTADHMAAVLERLSRSAGPGARESGRVFCLMPAKGASGATTLACSIAFLLKKTGVSRVLLVDFDPLASTVSFQLKARSQFSFLDALTRDGGLDSDLWRGLTCSVHGIDVLLAPDAPVHDADELLDCSRIIRFARKHYDAIVLDTGGPYGTWNLSIARHSDDLLLVTTNELPSLQATQRALAHLDRHRIEREKIRIIVNQYDRSVGVSQDLIEAALQQELYCVLPAEHEVVHRSLVEGKPIPGGSGLGKGMNSLALRLLGREAKRAEDRSSVLGGLFSMFRR